MTFKEKWIQDHPGEEFDFGRTGMCPYDFEYESNPNGSVGCIHHKYSCEDCWDREMSEEKLTFNHTGEPLAKVKKVVAENGGATAYIEPIIKDSGDRTEFETGAVRDMREGKGRCDLMPLEVVAKYICDSTDSLDTIIWALKMFLQSNSTSYLYSALNTFDVMAWDCAYTMCLEVAKHFEEGAKKYGENNWQKGIPPKCYIDSAIRHYLKWRRGDKDEPHDRAFVWNIMCCIWEVDYHKKDTETKNGCI